MAEKEVRAAGRGGLSCWRLRLEEEGPEADGRWVSILKLVLE